MLPSPPPSLVQYEPPLSVGEEGATKPKAAASGKATEAHLEEILNSILPPRYDLGVVGYFFPCGPPTCLLLPARLPPSSDESRPSTVHVVKCYREIWACDGG